MKCFYTGCKNEATHTLTSKAIGKREAFDNPCCKQCAAKVGAATGSPLIDQPNMESAFYKLTELSVK